MTKLTHKNHERKTLVKWQSEKPKGIPVTMENNGVSLIAKV